jgi:hypothetical protein
VDRVDRVDAGTVRRRLPACSGVSPRFIAPREKCIRETEANHRRQQPAGGALVSPGQPAVGRGGAPGPAGGEMTVGQLTEALGRSQPAVSHGLHRLRTRSWWAFAAGTCDLSVGRRVLPQSRNAISALNAPAIGCARPAPGANRTGPQIMWFFRPFQGGGD